MKIYIASRSKKRQQVKGLYKRFQKMGHEIVVDWTKHKIYKPFEKNLDRIQEYSIQDINGAKDCDIFIILSDDAGTGMYVELGAAIASNIEIGKPKIYAIGNYTSHPIFYFHPAVNRKNSIEEVFEEIKKGP